MNVTQAYVLRTNNIFDNLIEPHLASRFVICQRCSQTVDTEFASDISGEEDDVFDDGTENTWQNDY